MVPPKNFAFKVLSTPCFRFTFLSWKLLCSKARDSSQSCTMAGNRPKAQEDSKHKGSKKSRNTRQTGASKAYAKAAKKKKEQEEQGQLVGAEAGGSADASSVGQEALPDSHQCDSSFSLTMATNNNGLNSAPQMPQLIQQYQKAIEILTRNIMTIRQNQDRSDLSQEDKNRLRIQEQDLQSKLTVYQTLLSNITSKIAAAQQQTMTDSSSMTSGPSSPAFQQPQMRKSLYFSASLFVVHSCA